MKACFLITDARWSGRARAFAEAASGLTARGDECVILCRSPAVANELPAWNLSAEIFDFDGGGPRVAWRLRAGLRACATDVVFVHHEREHQVAALAVRFAGRGAVARRVPAARADAPLWRGRLADRIAPGATIFAFEDDRDSARPSRHTLGAFIVPPAVSGVAFERAAAGGACHVALLAGESNNARLLPVLRAVALVIGQHVDVTVDIVGTALDADALRINAAALHIGHLVRVANGESHALAARRALEHADVAWVAGDEDDAAGAMLDAFSADAALAVERSRLSQRLVPVDAPGMFLPTGGAPELAAHLITLATDSALRRRLANAGRATLGSWSSAAMVDGYRAVLGVAREHQSATR